MFAKTVYVDYKIDKNKTKLQLDLPPSPPPTFTDQFSWVL